MAAPTPVPSWEQLFVELSPADQVLAMDLYWSELRIADEGKAAAQRLTDALARALRFRPQSLRRLARDRLVSHLRAHCRAIFAPADWAWLFLIFYREQRTALMVAFLDHLAIPHDGRGLMSEDAEPPAADALMAAAEALGADFPWPEVRHYVCVLHHSGARTWQHLDTVLARLSGEDADDVRPAESPLPPAERDLVLDRFTTLDRVLIDQVIATVSEEDGALDPDALEDLVETVVALNGKRKRSIFHLGFLDGLVDGRALQFDRGEFNDRRRGWYLAGVLAAKTRQNDADAVRRLLAEHARDFQAAADDAGAAGSVMANMLLDFLVGIGRHPEALMLLQGQLKPAAQRLDQRLTLARRAYEHATELWRRQQSDAALSILRLLRQRVPALEVAPEQAESLLIQVERRYGQCLQRSGDLDGAAAIFAGILGQVGDGARPDLHADMGLVQGGFRSLDQVRLPENQAGRDSMRAALSRGESHFRLAIDAAGEQAVNACYALAVRDYLAWADQAGDDADARDQALRLVEMALIGMRASPAAAAYERMGVLGQALFIAIVLGMDKLTPGESHNALAQWQRIPADAGLFPRQDIQRLLASAELLNPQIAARIAESVWRKRPRGEAWRVLGPAAVRLSEHSDFLEAQLLQEARDARNPRARRFGIWTLLVPAFLGTCRNQLASEGLDALETLAEDPAQGQALLDWLADSAHYDPIWSETDADWVRVRLARRLGRDADCIHRLIGLFHRLRDEDTDEAAQTARLLTAWRLDPAQGEALLGSLPAEQPLSAAADIDARLRAGAPVRLLFVGGNEIQARNDQSISRHLAGEWPGVQVAFEHTGWSSNWGRDVDRLVKLGNEADAVVIMRMIRTLLGRALRERIGPPWIACTGTGRGMMLESLRQAARIAIAQRDAGR